MWRRLFFIVATSLLLAACGTEPDYKEYWNTVRRELSSPDYYGRNAFGDGDVRAARYIIDEVRKERVLEKVPWIDSAGERRVICDKGGQELEPGDLGRIASFGKAARYAPYLQNFKAPRNVFDGAMCLSIDGKVLRNCDDFQMRSFSPGCHGTYLLSYLPDEGYEETALESFLASGLYKDTFVMIDYNRLGKMKGGRWHYFKDVFTEIDPEKVGGIILLSDYVKSPIGFSSVGVDFLTSVPVIAVKSCVIPEGAKMLSADIDQSRIPEHDSHNISVFLPGTDRSLEEYFVLMAHYDHHGVVGVDNIFCGANDNASSSALLLALARYFTRHIPARGIQFIWVDEEESNLYGSYYYTANPAMPLDKIKFLINFEQTADNGNDLWAGCNDEGRFELEKLLSINEDGDYPAFNTVRAGFGDNSDHYAFGIKGVPVCYVATVGDNNSHFYHTTADTFDNTSDENFDRLFNMVVKYISNN